ncbi:MAG: hypothetical protein JXA82_08555 [Sedimentisphaerales bacterium]|nr:hypothetical protein [Sedimentisphaerales bacterium]
MRKGLEMVTKRFWLSFSVVFLVGCVPSLHRLYDDKTLVFEEQLLGRWMQDNEDTTWTFEKEDNEKTYKLTVVGDNGKSGKFKVHLVRLEGMLFMDMFPGDLDDEKMHELYAIHLIPGHTFLKVIRTETGWDLHMMNPDKIEEMLQEKPDLVKHEIMDDGDGIVLTAGTKELQKFVVNCAKTEKAFGEAMELVPAKPLKTTEQNQEEK